MITKVIYQNMELESKGGGLIWHPVVQCGRVRAGLGTYSGLCQEASVREKCRFSAGYSPAKTAFFRGLSLLGASIGA